VPKAFRVGGVVEYEADMIAFSGNPLDRASDKRTDTAWLASRRGGSNARVLPLWKLQPLLLGTEAATDSVRLGFLDGALASGLGGEDAVEIFLGLRGEGAFFARDVSALTDPLAAALANYGHFRDARAAAARLDPGETAILAQAKALIDWHNRHRFCAQCGTPTAAADAGYRRLCSNCRAEHFPRTDPAVIMLVTRGNECLLGRNRRFRGGHFSTLAGFLEPGETIEEAVAREIFEEVGLHIRSVRYFASQPWPFPSSLMIGCFAEADSATITPDGHEIVAARWFDHATIKRMVAGASGEVPLPRRDAIAFHLIEHWAETGPWT
jgi:NAD+ diphosphatase